MTTQVNRVRMLTKLLLASLDGYERHPKIYDKLDCDAKLLTEALVELRIGLGRDGT